MTTQATPITDAPAGPETELERFEASVDRSRRYVAALRKEANSLEKGAAELQRRVYEHEASKAS